jgi:hypothetical protein
LQVKLDDVHWVHEVYKRETHSTLGLQILRQVKVVVLSRKILIY